MDLTLIPRMPVHEPPHTKGYHALLYYRSLLHFTFSIYLLYFSGLLDSTLVATVVGVVLCTYYWPVPGIKLLTHVCHGLRHNLPAELALWRRSAWQKYNMFRL